MADLLEIGIGNNQLFPINSGAIRFKCKGTYVTIWLVTKEKPYESIYEISLHHPSSSVTCKNGATESFQTNITFNDYSFQELWLSWHSGRICVGCIREAPFLEFIGPDKETHNQIGYIQFYKPDNVENRCDWEVEVSPHSVAQMQIKLFENGKLHWVKMTGDELPLDALIGGFEDEPTYIARAYHNNSLCPGRYIPSKKVALIGWGLHAHEKDQNIEILCGFDAIWIKTTSNKIPENAFVAGHSEICNEPLYIGRAMHNGNMLTGKVHVLYKCCYLPYRGQEIMVGSFELLVLPYKTLRGTLDDCAKGAERFNFNHPAWIL